jgi:hypothetical protein
VVSLMVLVETLALSMRLIHLLPMVFHSAISATSASRFRLYMQFTMACQDHTIKWY